MDADRYTHGHHESVLRSHRWRTAENSAGYLLAHLSPGMSLLDVGCGPGNITGDLASRLGDGVVVGIDVSEEIIDVAHREALVDERANLRFEVGDVYQLGFADESFDVVHAHQVLQHLGRPVAALGEMRRVLRPGGILAVRDADYGAFVWAPTDPVLDRWMELYHQITRRNGADADAGRHLKRWVRDAGFEDGVTTSANWTYETAAQRAWWGGLWAERVRESEFARQGVEYELTTRSELDDISGAFERWADAPDGIFIVVNVEVLARR